MHNSILQTTGTWRSRWADRIRIEDRPVTVAKSVVDIVFFWR